MIVSSNSTSDSVNTGGGPVAVVPSFESDGLALENDGLALDNDDLGEDNETVSPKVSNEFRFKGSCFIEVRGSTLLPW
jgi:hypothetical protein